MKVQYLFTMSERGPHTFGLKLDIDLLRAADLARHESRTEVSLTNDVSDLGIRLKHWIFTQDQTRGEHIASTVAPKAERPL